MPFTAGVKRYTISLPGVANPQVLLGGLLPGNDHAPLPAPSVKDWLVCKVSMVLFSQSSLVLNLRASDQADCAVGEVEFVLTYP